MNRHVAARLAGVLAVSLSIPPAWASTSGGYTFGIDRQVNDGSGAAHTNTPARHSVFGRGSSAFVLFADNREDYPAIFVARSGDRGDMFESEVRVNESGSGERPSMAASADGKRLYVIWDGVEFGYQHTGLFFDRSLDGGATFGPDVFVPALSPGTPFPDGWATAAAVATDGTDLVLIAWSFDDSIYVLRSVDAGSSFTPGFIAGVDPSAAFSGPPQVFDATVASDGTVYLFYTTWEGDIGASAVLHLLRSRDGGLSYDRFDGGWGLSTCAAVSGPGTIHVASTQYEYVTGDSWPAYAGSTDGGGSWPLGRIMDDPYWVAFTEGAIGARDRVAAMVWTRPVEGRKLVVSASRDDGATWGPVADVSDQGVVQYPSVDISDRGDIYVAWMMNYKVYFDRGRYSPATDVAAAAYPARADAGAITAIRAAPNPSGGSFTLTAVRPSGAAWIGNGAARLEIFDVSGRRIRALDAPSSVVWDGRDDAGHLVPSGIYFARTGGADRDAQPARLVIER